MTQTVSVTVPSATTPGLYYIVSRVNGFETCTCPGFEYRGRCKHLAFAPTPTDVAEPAEACGICNVVHDCHCPKMMAWCDACELRLCAPASVCQCAETYLCGPCREVIEREWLGCAQLGCSDPDEAA